MADDTVQDCRVITPITGLDVILSFIICFVTVLVFIVLEPRFVHWCLIPLIICGVIVGTDAMRWLRGGVDTFDPKGLVGIFGLNFFFLAPLLVIHYNPDYSKYGGTPTDWRLWIGYMGWLNTAGLITYQLTQSFAFKDC